MAKSTGPACGNNPNYLMSDGDRKAVDDFKARLALQAAAKPYIDSADWVDGDPLMETIAVTLWKHCARDHEDQPQAVCDDPRTIAAFAAAVARAETEAMRERHKASLRRADEVNNQLMEEVQRYAAGTERPVLWSVYNRMHLRALAAETVVKRGTALYERWVKAGPPPLGASLARWWDARLVELRSAILPAGQPAADETQPGAETDDPLCICMHPRSRHLKISGRLLCDDCVPDSTENLVCKEFEAL